MTKIDMSGIPIIDHHAHALIKTSEVMTMERYQGFFTESPNPIMKARYVLDTIMWQWAVRELATYLGCEATAEAVLAARNALALQELANGMWRDQNSEM